MSVPSPNDLLHAVAAPPPVPLSWPPLPPAPPTPFDIEPMVVLVLDVVLVELEPAAPPAPAAEGVVDELAAPVPPAVCDSSEPLAHATSETASSAAPFVNQQKGE